MKAIGILLAMSLALCLSALPGCSSTGMQVSARTASQLKEGVTTEPEILAALGKPTSMAISGGQKTLTYSGAQCQTKGATFTPVVGIFAGGMDCQSSAVVIQPDPAGVARKITDLEHTIGSRNGPMPDDQHTAVPTAR